MSHVHGRMRNSSYYKKVRVGKRTVRDGECCAVWDLRGKQHLHTGPKRMWIFFSRVSFLDFCFADQNQFLRIERVTGEVEHKRGPASMYANPLYHKAVTVQDAMRLESGETVVVYTANEDSSLSRRCVNGPTLLFTEPNERFHTFQWHVGDAEHKGAIVLGKPVEKVKTITNQLYFNVHEVRTRDDAILTVKLMVFYQLADLDKLLDTSSDPLLDMMHALSADVVQFAAQNTFENFLGKTEQLSNLDSYSSLVERANAIGFKVEKVVYRGYNTTQGLQELHNQAVKSRTDTKLKLEAEQQRLEMEAFSLAKRLQLTNKEHEMVLQRARHAIELDDSAAQSAQRQTKQRLQEELDQAKRANALRVGHYKQLASNGVDVSEVLCAPVERVEKTVRVVEASTMGKITVE